MRLSFIPNIGETAVNASFYHFLTVKSFSKPTGVGNSSMIPRLEKTTVIKRVTDQVISLFSV